MQNDTVRFICKSTDFVFYTTNSERGFRVIPFSCLFQSVSIFLYGMGAVFSRSLSVGPISNDHARLDLDCPQFEAWLTAFIAKNLPTVPGALQTQIIEAFKNVNGVSFFKWKLFEIKAKLRNINGLSAVIDIENFARSLFCTFHKGKVLPKTSLSNFVLVRNRRVLPGTRRRRI